MPTQSWKEVDSYYEKRSKKDGRPFEQMLQLVRYLEASQDADKLFPYTSQDVLHIASVQMPSLNDKELQVQFNPNNSSFIFTHSHFLTSSTCEETEWKHTLKHELLQCFPNLTKG